MATSKEIKLVNGFDWHRQRVNQLRLKEPTGLVVAELGEPRVLVRTINGAYFVEQTQIIRQYIEKCLEHEGGGDIVNLLSMADYMMIKDEILDFFIQAEAKIAALKLTPLSSGSKS